MQFEERGGDAEEDLVALVQKDVPDPQCDFGSQGVHEETHEPLDGD